MMAEWALEPRCEGLICPTPAVCWGNADKFGCVAAFDSVMNQPISPSLLRESDKHAGLDGPSPLDRLAYHLDKDMKAVDRLIVDRMRSPVALIPQLAGYIVAAGGKRLRPMLTVASARLFGYEGEAHRTLAACVEFIHTATLLHDDVVDESELRRGKESANNIFGNNASVLVGDFLFSRSFELMVENGSLEVLRILSRASSVIAEGEVLQLMTTSDLGTNEAAYLQVVESKTAALFAAACQIGGVVAGQPKEVCDKLYDYGLSLGVAFQIVDDVLDYSAERARLGKSIGDDFREGKLTLPVVYALERADGGADRDFWSRTLENLDQTESDLDQAMNLLSGTEALERSLEKARSYGTAAREALASLPDGPITEALRDIVDFTIERQY